MVQIRSERYTPLLKGYLTYPYNSKIVGVLLTERKDRRYIVEIDNIKFTESWITKPLLEAIQKKGGNVSIIEKVSTTGKTRIFGIPVEIRKITNKTKVEAIRIRVIGQNITKLVLNIEKIKKELSQWGIKPKECLWDRSGDLKINMNTEDKSSLLPNVDENDIIKEQKKLKNDIDDLKDQINYISSIPIKKTIREEKKVMRDILK